MKDQAVKVDITKKVDAVATKDHPTIKPGEKFQCGIITKAELIKKGYAEDDTPKAEKEEKPAKEEKAATK